jgi:hypothetical protein
MVSPIIIFTYQSYTISLQNWFSYFTVCLTPLAAHIFAGVSSITTFPPFLPLARRSEEQPPWHALLPHYNPISIVWRYYMIVDRRVRLGGRHWTPSTLACSNAVFWDPRRREFRSGPDLLISTERYLTRIPASTHVELISGSAILSYILAFQTSQAIIWIVDSFQHPKDLGLPFIFYPLGCLGAARVIAAIWLSSDYSYGGSWEEDGHITIVQSSGIEMAESYRRNDSITADSEATIQHVPSQTQEMCDTRQILQDILAPKSSPRGILFRIFWMLTFFPILITSATVTSRWFWATNSHNPYYSYSHIVVNVMYFITTTFAVIIHAYYIFSGQTDNTVIPCIGKWWYKAFTAFLGVMGLLSVVLACLETRTTMSGTTTSTPEFVCANRTVCVPTGLGMGDTNL